MSRSQQETLQRRGEVEQIGKLVPRFIEHLRSHDRSERTIKSYSSDVKLFARWLCETSREELSRQSMTPIDLSEYKRHLLGDRGFKPAQSTEEWPAFRPSSSERKSKGLPMAIPATKSA